MSIDSFRRAMMLAASVTTFSLLFACGGGGGGGGGGSPQPSTWVGTKQLGAAGASTRAQAAAVDHNGNVYVVGYVDGALDGNTRSGDTDLFLTKYSSSGARLFTRQLGVSGADTQAQGVTVDSSNNVYVVGYTGGSLAGESRSGANDAFLIKYNSSGASQYTKLLGVSGADTQAKAVAVDRSGNVFVVGYTTGALGISAPVGRRDVFVAKYTSSGTRLGISQFGGSGGLVEGNSVALDSSGNAYVVGPTDVGVGGNSQTGSYDLFLVKLSGTTLDVVFTKQMGSTSGQVVPEAVVLDSNGYINVAGITSGNFDGHTRIGSWDTFLIQFDSAGVRTAQSSQQMGVSGFEARGAAIAADGNGNVYVAGYTTGGLDGNTLTGAWSDAFLTKFNSSYAKQFTRQLGPTGASAYGTGVAVNTSGDVFITGQTTGGLDGNTLTGAIDTFVTKYNSAGVKQ